MSITNIKINNFRVFGLNGKPAEFELKPITILTGPNSSGKSSLGKALLLLKENFKTGILNNIDFSGDIHKLGDIERVVNKIDKDVTIKITIDNEISIQWEIAGTNSALDDNGFSKINNITFFYKDKELFILNFKDDRENIIDNDEYFCPIKISLELLRNLITDNIIDLKIEKEENIDSILGNAIKLASLGTSKILAIFNNDKDNISKKEVVDLDNVLDSILDKVDFKNSIELFLYYDNRSAQEIFLRQGFKNINELSSSLKLDRKIIKTESHRGNNLSELIYSDNRIINDDKIKDKNKILLKDSTNMDNLFKLTEKYKYPIELNLLLSELNNFVRNFIQTTIDTLEKIYCIEAIRGIPQEVYNINDGMLLSKLVKDYHYHFDNDEPAINEDKSEIKIFIEKWLSKFEICDSLKTEKISSNIFQLQLISNEKIKYLTEVGFGFTSLLPIIINIALIGGFAKAQNKSITILIEEPEIHLHPKLQSMLADFFVDALDNFNFKINFIIETHSEYIIRKIQCLQNDYHLKIFDYPQSINKLVIIYYLNDLNLQEANYWPLNILDNGLIDKRFGTGFFDETNNLVQQLF